MTILKWTIQDFYENGEYRKTTLVTSKYRSVVKILEKRGIHFDVMYYLDELDQTRHKQISGLMRSRVRKKAETNEGVMTRGQALERLRVAKARYDLIVKREKEVKDEITRAENIVKRFPKPRSGTNTDSAAGD